MSTFAHIGSVAALKEFRVALCKFIEVATAAQAEADAEAHRVMVWLKQDRYPYWKAQQRLGAEKVNQARLVLEQKKAFNLSRLDEQRSFIDEKRALAQAQKALQEAEQKLKNIQRWIPLLEQETYNYRGLSQRLGSDLTTELPNGRAALDRMTDALEAYLALAPVAAEPLVSAAESSASKTRPTAELAGVFSGYAVLRTLVPDAAIRAGLTPGHRLAEWLTAVRLDPTASSALIDLKIPPDSPAARQKVAVAHIQGDHPRLFLERSRPAGEDDSGWTLGPADGTRVNAFEAITIGDLIEVRADLAGLLTLPQGYMVVLKGAMIEAVLNAQDQMIWPVMDKTAVPEASS